MTTSSPSNAVYSKVMSEKTMTLADLTGQAQVADPAETGVASTLETEDHVAYLNGNANGPSGPTAT